MRLWLRLQPLGDQRAYDGQDFTGESAFFNILDGTALGIRLPMLAQINLHEFKASQHVECIVAVTIKPETESGKHKVKISGRCCDTVG